MIEAHEIEVFRRYRLDVNRVAFLRARLQCIPPYPLKELRRKARKANALIRKLKALEREFNAITNEVLAEPGNPGIVMPWWEGHVWQYGVFFTCQWDLLEEKWGTRMDEIPTERYKLLEDYPNRPTKESALRIWNAFLIAFRSTPERFIRVWALGYWAAYRDRNGDVLWIGADWIRPHVNGSRA